MRVSASGAAIAVLVCVGCVTGDDLSNQSTIARNADHRTGAGRAMERDLEQARRQIDSTEPSLALPRLLEIISRGPDSAAGKEARYLLGMAYYRLNAYREAIGMFGEYLRAAPDGPYADSARDHISLLTDEYREKFPSQETLDAQIALLEGRLAQRPNDTNAQWELAELLWKRGHYEEAEQMYSQILASNPDAAGDPRLANRVEFIPSDGFVVLTPADIQQRERERRPLEIFNTSSYRGGEDFWTRRASYYVVTGQAVNRADSPLYGVRVDITVYGFGNMIFDTHMVNLGTLNPGETRAFVARFRNFNNIENVSRYECVGAFQR
jgi:tetratricopeptide (TPR) repeat protein